MGELRQEYYRQHRIMSTAMALPTDLAFPERHADEHSQVLRTTVVFRIVVSVLPGAELVSQSHKIATQNGKIASLTTMLEKQNAALTALKQALTKLTTVVQTFQSEDPHHKVLIAQHEAAVWMPPRVN